MPDWLTILILLAFIAAAVHLFGIFGSGYSDGEFPSIAGGDYRTGWRRKLYLLGRKRGDRYRLRKEERQRITRERRK